MVQPMVQQLTEQQIIAKMAQRMKEQDPCPECDTNSEDGDKYCMTCGRRLNGDAEFTTTSCLKCNKNPTGLYKQTLDKEIFCPRCRARVTELYVQNIQTGI